MAPMVYLAAGDLVAARRYAQQRSELPFFREADHLAVEWLLTTAAIAGDFDEADALAQRFRRGWKEAGSPPLGGIAFAPAAAAMAYGIRGDDEARLEWLQIFTEMRRVVKPARERYPILSPAFEGMVALHRGEIGVALGYVAGEPESFKPWHDAAWRPWYTAVWAEAGVFGRPARPTRPSRPREVRRARRTRSPRRSSSGPPRSMPATTRHCSPRRRPGRRGLPVPAGPHPGPRRRRRTRGGSRAPGRARCRPDGGARLIAVADVRPVAATTPPSTCRRSSGRSTGRRRCSVAAT